MGKVTEMSLTSKGSSISDVPFAETSISDSASSMQRTSSSYFTESNSTIGNSVSLPTMVSSLSGLETDVDSGSCVSEVRSSERATSEEYSGSDEHDVIQLQAKDSVNLAHQRIGPRRGRNDTLDSTSNAIQKGSKKVADTDSVKSSLSSSSEYARGSISETTSSEDSYSLAEIEITSRRPVSFLPASCSEIMRQSEKKGPVTRRHRIKEKKSAPLFSTPMQVTYNKGSGKISKDSETLGVIELRKTVTKTSASGDSSQEPMVSPSDSSLKSKSFSSAESSDATNLSSCSSAGFMSSSSEAASSSSSSMGFQSLGSSISSGSSGTLTSFLDSIDERFPHRTSTYTSASSTNWMNSLDSSNETDTTAGTDQSLDEVSTLSSEISNQSELRSSLSSPIVSSSVHGNSKLGVTEKVKRSSFGRCYSNKNNCHTEDPEEDNGENENNSSNTMLLAQESQSGENIHLHSLQNQLTADNKSKALRRSITRLSPRSREALDKYLEDDNQAQSSVISQSTTSGTGMPTTSAVEPVTERDVSQFYHLCTISDYEEEENDDETGSAPPSSDEDCTKNRTPSGVGFLNATGDQMILKQQDASFSSNFSDASENNDDMEEIVCSETDRSAPECKRWVSTEKLLRDMALRVKVLGMLIDNENDHDMETDLNEELHHYDEEERFTPEVNDLDVLINSRSDLDINTDLTNELHLDVKQRSSEDEEGDSVRNTFTESVGGIKENFLNLIDIQASQARCDDIVRKTLDKEENDKQSAKDNKVHPLHINQEVGENVEDNTSTEQTGARWGDIYQKFPSFWRISEDEDDDDMFDRAYLYEGSQEFRLKCFQVISVCVLVYFSFMLLFVVLISTCRFQRCLLVHIDDAS